MGDPAKRKIPERACRRLTPFFAMLLLIATLSTATCIYQATRWNAIRADDYGESAMFRTESTHTTTIANQLQVFRPLLLV
jgi:hypothetical protein